MKVSGLIRYLSREILCLFIVLFFSQVHAQNIGINSTGAPPSNSAMLDVKSTSKGILFPRMTTVQRNLILAPDTSLVIFNTTTQCFEFYTGAAWQVMSCTCTTAPSTP